MAKKKLKKPEDEMETQPMEEVHDEKAGEFLPEPNVESKGSIMDLQEVETKDQPDFDEIPGKYRKFVK